MHRLTFELELNRAECEFLTGELARRKNGSPRCQRAHASTVDSAAVTCVRINLYTTLDQSDRAVAVGLEYLRAGGRRMVAASDGGGRAPGI